MEEIFEPLFTKREGWWRIYPDLPGFGQTRAADWITCQDDMLVIVLEFMDSIAPRENFVVAGVSYGGYLARGIIHNRSSQIDGMAIVVPVVELDSKKQNLPEHRIIKEDAEYAAALRPDEAIHTELLTVQSMEILQSLRDKYASAVAIADHEFLKRLENKFPFSFEVDSLPQPFPAPALILTGRFDHWCGYREAYKILDNYPRATYAVLDKTGHALALEEKVLFQALANDWLDRVEEYTR